MPSEWNEVLFCFVQFCLCCRPRTDQGWRWGPPATPSTPHPSHRVYDPPLRVILSAFYHSGRWGWGIPVCRIRRGISAHCKYNRWFSLLVITATFLASSGKSRSVVVSLFARLRTRDITAFGVENKTAGFSVSRRLPNPRTKFEKSYRTSCLPSRSCLYFAFS